MLVTVGRGDLETYQLMQQLACSLIFAFISFHCHFNTHAKLRITRKQNSMVAVLLKNEELLKSNSCLEKDPHNQELDKKCFYVVFFMFLALGLCSTSGSMYTSNSL